MSGAIPHFPHASPWRVAGLFYFLHLIIKKIPPYRTTQKRRLHNQKLIPILISSNTSTTVSLYFLTCGMQNFRQAAY
jgi:hypothetical protein